jgi:diguanylate cyclase (GGDEF)-like protein
MTDALVIVVFIYFSGGERSWLLIFIAAAVANQTHTSAVRALITGHMAVLAYAGVLLLYGVSDFQAAGAKVLIFYLVVWVYIGTAMIAWRDRRDSARKLQKAKTRAELLQVAGRVATESLELRDVLPRVLEQLQQVVHYDGASIQLLEGDAMRVIAVRGLPESEIGRVRSLAEFPYNRRLATSSDPVILDLPAPGLWFPVPGREQLRSVMGVPLIVRDKHIGAMSIDSLVPHAFGTEETEVAKGFAAQMAVAIDNARLYEAVREQSWRDGLTGVANRRRFDDLLAAACRRSTPIALIMMDIDSFKLFNDHYGHAAGDDVLRTVAAELQKSFPCDDELFARYGGEEFVALLPSVTLEQAFVRADRLCAEVAALAIPHAYSPHGRVTLSLGVGTTIEEADRALYEAKRAGRNRVAGAAGPRSAVT